MEKKRTFAQRTAALATAVTRWTGSSWGFTTAGVIVIVWALLGPVFKFSDTWQLVINTGTTIVTFLMVFLIQRSQNKDSLAIQLKLNELVAAIEHANNHLIDIEEISEDELEMLRSHYRRLAEIAREEQDIEESYSQHEAEVRSQAKAEHRRLMHED